MPLTLTIRNIEQLANGSPTSLILDQRGAVIGRSPTTDWCLPDPNLHISSRHCEIQYRDGSYILNDVSTNGTFLSGQSARLPGPHLIQPGDLFVVGQYEIQAALDDQTASAMAARNANPEPPQWKGWNAASQDPSAQPVSQSNWDSRPTGSAISGTGPMSQSWAPPKTDAEPPSSSGWAPPASPAAPPPMAPPQAAPSSGWDSAPASSGWEAPAAAPQDGASSWVAPTPSPAPASGWSSPIPDQQAAPSANDVWGQIAASNVVDWARGGFGTPSTLPPAQDPLGLSPAPAFQAAPVAPPPANTPVAPVQPSAAPATPSTASGGGGLDIFLAAAGLTTDTIRQGDAETLAQAGNTLRRIVAGLVVMLEARARAKSQMGAQGTSLEFDGNNPLKFARTPEQALAQLLNPPERGFMGTDRAIEDSFRDLQAHQMATLKAMQGALRATLDRFSPKAIRARATKQGLMAKILPGAKDAALWQAYEKEFSGVAQGSDEAFMDVFAKEFRKAYEEVARGGG